MSFHLIEQLSLPGSAERPNEDASAFLDHAVLVMDGATPLGPSLLPGPSDAAWIAQFGARRLAAHLKDGDAPREALRQALMEAEKSFVGLARAPIREKWQMPCASMMMAVDHGAEASSDGRGSTIEFLWFGDCAALVEQDGEVVLIGDALKKRKAEADRAKRVAKEKNISAASGVSRPEIEPLLRAARNRINSGQNWLFSPDARAAAHVTRKMLTITEGATLLIASDGFLALISDYNIYDPKGLMAAAKTKGLAALGRELRAIEEKDASGERFFRFKKSDDSTALFVRVG